MKNLAIILSSTLTLMLFLAGNVSYANSCENDPNECTPQNLCEVSTEMISGQKVWSEKSELAGHIKFAKQIGIDCGATDLQEPCDLDAAKCKISELCERATKGSTDKQWDNNKPEYVSLAKEYNLSCDVVDAIQQDKQPVKCTLSSAKTCSEESLCAAATKIVDGKTVWVGQTDLFVVLAKERGLSCDGAITSEAVEELCFKATRNFVGGKVIWMKNKYAKQAIDLGLDCGVAAFSNDCDVNVTKCSDRRVCEGATKILDGKNTWLPSYQNKFVTEAKSRNLTCGVDCNVYSTQSCSSDVLCKLATEKRNGLTQWQSDNSTFAIAAKARGLTCGVKDLPAVKYERYNFTNDREGEVTIGVVDSRGNWNGERVYSWPNGAALYLGDWRQDKTYNSNSNTNGVFPRLTNSFNALPSYKKKTIQENLKRKNMYSGSIDGAWGRNTLIALVEYSSKKYLSIQLNNGKLVDAVLDAIESDASFSTVNAAVTEIAAIQKALSDQKAIENKVDDFKSSFLSQTQLKRKQIQYALNKLGYYRSGIDGLWGGGTQNAITSFASVEGLSTKSPSQLFSNLLSRVSVPTSFAATRGNNSNLGNNNSRDTNKKSSMGYTKAQATAICKPQAELAKANARRNFTPPNATVNCNKIGYTLNCSQGLSGGAWGGILAGLTAANVGNNAYEATMSSCMAQYGWY